MLNRKNDRKLTLVIVAIFMIFIFNAILNACAWSVDQAVESIPKGDGNCAYEMIEVDTVRLGKIKIPAVGKIVEESHYVTQEDQFAGYPASSDHGIKEHLEKSCKMLEHYYGIFSNADECQKKIYRQSWEKVWTPAENGGNIGGNARGKKLPVDQEMWQANMYFTQKSFPNPGEKWLIKNPKNGKSVVVAVGYELGPGGREFIAGASVETHYYLESDNNSQLEIGKLIDQGLKYGPVKCE